MSSETNRCKKCGKFISNDEVYCIMHQKNKTKKFETSKNGKSAVGSLYTKQRPENLEQVIKMFNVDKKIWIVERWLLNSWDVTNKNGVVCTNYQIKVFFKRNDIVFNYDKIKKEFREFAKEYVPDYKDIKYNFKKQKENNLLEVNISDLHLGKLCWGLETGENFDVKIAQERFLNILKQIMYRVSVFDYDKILFPIGNDFFNADGNNNMTTYGTPQDNDIRGQKLYKIGRELLIKAIDYLKEFAPVDVIVIPGNHDFERMYYVGDALDLWYSKCNNVTVNNSPKIRKYYNYGNVLIGFTHGSNEKLTDLPLIMAQEVSDLWGKTKFREMHIGHWHHKKEISYITTNEYKGVIVRQLKSPTGIDAWHMKKGFIGSIKGAEAFVWNKETGLSALININI